MRMGSFAYRATQFFENLGKKSNSKRKTSSLSSPADADYNLRDGIQEESSLSSASIGLPGVSPSSETASPVFEDSFLHSSAFSSPTSPEPPPLPSTPPPRIPVSVKHQGRELRYSADQSSCSCVFLWVFSPLDFLARVYELGVCPRLELSSEESIQI